MYMYLRPCNNNTLEREYLNVNTIGFVDLT